MTKEQIEQMPGCNEMETLINVEIFGLQPLSEIEKKAIHDWNELVNHRGGMPVLDRVFKDAAGRLIWGGCYWDEMRGAWYVVEKMREKGYGFVLGNGAEGEWNARFVDGEERWFLAEAESAPLAICRAALKAVLGLNKRGVL